MANNTLQNLLLSELKRRLFEESIPRIITCLEELTDDEIWLKANMNTNSAGNLVLHLDGNVRQYILSGLAGRKDERNRDLEFNEIDPIPKEKLINILEKLQLDVMDVLPEIEKSDLVKKRAVQCFEESGVSILVHVIEHFSYHTGQIVYFTKYIKNIDTSFYGNLDLDARANQ